MAKESDRTAKSEWKRALALALAISSAVFVAMGSLTTLVSVMVRDELSSSGSATADGMLQMALLCRVVMPIAGIVLAVVGIACAFASVLQRIDTRERVRYVLWASAMTAAGAAIVAGNVRWLI